MNLERTSKVSPVGYNAFWATNGRLVSYHPLPVVFDRALGAK
jgi:hypothetical protein